MENRKRIFISHSSADKIKVNKLLKRLQDFGIDDTWYDIRELSASSNLPASISDGILQSEYFILCISEYSARSQWVSFETQVAIQNNKKVLAILFSSKDKSVILENPFLNQAVQGGKLKILDLEVDFDESIIELICTIDSNIGNDARIKYRLKTILNGDDPDVAEREMGFAALEAGDYLAEFLLSLSDIRDSRLLTFRAGRFCCHIADEAVVPLLSVLTLTLSIPEKPIASRPASIGTGDQLLTGQSALDYIRWVTLNPVAQGWAAMVGAEYCLVAMGLHNPRLKARILGLTNQWLREQITFITDHRDEGFSDEYFDALRLTIETVGRLAPDPAIDLFLIRQFVTN